MKKGNSKSVVIAFALVLAGLLCIQVYWVNSIINIRSLQFDNDVLQALNSTAAAAEQKENILLINESLGDGDTKIRSPKSKEKQVKIISKNSTVKKGNKTITSSYSYTTSNDSVNLNIESNDGSESYAGAFVFNSDNEDSVITKVIEDSSSKDDKISKIKIIIDKISQSHKDSSKLMPKGAEIEKNVAGELKHNNIDIPFQFGISAKNKKYYLSANADSAKVFGSSYKTELYPKDILKRDVVLFLNFPDKFSYLFGEIIWILLVVFIFSIVLIYLFIVTLNNYKQQKKLNELKSDFINNLTHELKTPLATIQLASEVIIKKTDDVHSPITSLAQTIKLQSKKMDDDVRNMLQIALLEHVDQSSISITTINAAELIQTSIEKMKFLAESKHIRLELYCNNDITFKGDRIFLEKAIDNLIDNAIKYSSENSLVNISAATENNSIVFKVSDNGIGISKEDLPHVFDKFYKAGSGNIHQNKGYGLGLSFVKKIAELHNGSVQAQSTVGKGTSISLILPLSI